MPARRMISIIFSRVEQIPKLAPLLRMGLPGRSIHPLHRGCISTVEKIFRSIIYVMYIFRKNAVYIAYNTPVSFHNFKNNLFFNRSSIPLLTPMISSSILLKQ